MAHSRIPSVKSCIKRLREITLTDLRKLSSRDLSNLIKLPSLMGPVQMVLNERKLGVATRPAFTSEFQEQ